MSDNLAPAIAVFERIIAEAERKAAEARSAINALYQAQGLPARYADDGGAQGGTGPLAASAIPTQIKRDSFYGKKQMTAIREILEMRRASGDGPATPREVVNALKAGGYEFQAKSDDIALVGVRALMRKATTVFRKLPGTNTYGLAVWYPNAKAAKPDSEPAGVSPPASKRPKKTGASKAASKSQATKPKAAKAKTAAKPRPARRARLRPSQKTPISTFVESALADGAVWTVDRLLTEAISQGVEGIVASDQRTKFKIQGVLMVLRRTNRAEFLGDGVWKIASNDAAPSGDGDRVVPIKGVA